MKAFRKLLGARKHKMCTYKNEYIYKYSTTAKWMRIIR